MNIIPSWIYNADENHANFCCVHSDLVGKKNKNKINKTLS